MADKYLSEESPNTRLSQWVQLSIVLWFVQNQRPINKIKYNEEGWDEDECAKFQPDGPNFENVPRLHIQLRLRAIWMCSRVLIFILDMRVPFFIRCSFRIRTRTCLRTFRFQPNPNWMPFWFYAPQPACKAAVRNNFNVFLKQSIILTNLKMTVCTSSVRNTNIMQAIIQMSSAFT